MATIKGLGWAELNLARKRADLTGV